MKVYRFLVFPLILFVVLMTACSEHTKIVPESELKKLPSQKLLELGAEKYSNMQYKDAIYYYSNLITIFKDDNDQDNESRAWATYEIGYIYYVQDNYNVAEPLFDEVLKMKSPTKAPQFLASEMKDKILAKKQKKY